MEAGSHFPMSKKYAEKEIRHASRRIEPLEPSKGVGKAISPNGSEILIWQQNQVCRVDTLIANLTFATLVPKQARIFKCELGLGLDEPNGERLG